MAVSTNDHGIVSILVRYVFCMISFKEIIYLIKRETLPNCPTQSPPLKYFIIGLRRHTRKVENTGRDREATAEDLSRAVLVRLAIRESS